MTPKAETAMLRIPAAVEWTPVCRLGRVAMYPSAARLATAVLVAGSGMYASYRLIVYADRDDAPGGMVIGAALMIGFLALGVWIARPREQKRSSNGS